ncbi:conserved hypothetical protein [Vibrio crassostreae]|nr:hypothetical protein BH584_22415 [Vibrio sp. 10N.261.45.E1]PMJ36668.1 hypothetical protein BCU27_23140 [Vibrio sp. 10N.286.45.B6]PML83733.1 hypothetical protein BCT66_18480 [Vibrio sp. 10N.261.49.E11]PMM65587.1 hypothetical protein BCT48_18980 [Vibrio sp. 10N.261.46.F12]PMM78686.1 hypothetical protein BCT46_21985 [Vibrio sp. 10N.261.46.E8]PMN42915.1 hypothetical protein BCT34_21815 [Vibrio sp. 10N.261.45.E2]PMN59498.1 hypothetical protein BCT32_01230 [Vibrio sp. 10N.261.45.E11]PMN82609.1 
MFKGFFYDLHGHEIKTLTPITLCSDLESSIVEVSLSLGLVPMIVSYQRTWALFEVNSQIRFLVAADV